MIDHHRVKVLVQYFHLNGWDKDTDTVKPGDIVVMDLNNGQWHIAIVSNKLSKDKKRWLVIHNWGNGVQEEDVLDEYPPFRCFRAPLKLIDKSHGQKTRACPYDIHVWQKWAILTPHFFCNTNGVRMCGCVDVWS